MYQLIMVFAMFAHDGPIYDSKVQCQMAHMLSAETIEWEAVCLPLDSPALRIPVEPMEEPDEPERPA